MIAVVAGVREELAALRAALESPRDVVRGDLRAVSGGLAGQGVVLAVAGDGAPQARSVLARLLEDIRCEGVIGVGIAGGLTDDLPAGRLVVGAEVLEPAGAVLVPDPRWRASAEAAGAAPASLLSTRAIAGTPTMKRALAVSLGLSTAAVDLESYAWAETASAKGVPWIVLRVVSDAAWESIPAFIVACQRDDGSIDRARVAAKGLAVPTRLGALLRLKRRVHDAAATLDQAVRAIMSDAPRTLSRNASREAM
jgi:adenosylhomocysteine nucleosidase